MHCLQRASNATSNMIALQSWFFGVFFRWLRVRSFTIQIWLSDRIRILIRALSDVKLRELYSSSMKENREDREATRVRNIIGCGFDRIAKAERTLKFSLKDGKEEPPTGEIWARAAENKPDPTYIDGFDKRLRTARRKNRICLPKERRIRLHNEKCNGKRRVEEKR